jgi:CRP-like cAMP-binding protein
MHPTPLFLSPIFNNIPIHEHDAFFDELKFKTKFFKKGDFIAMQGDTVHALYILLKGSVKTEMFSESGTVLNIETIHAPHPLASAFLFAENNQFPVDVVALEDVEVMLISKLSVMKQFACSESFLQGFMTFNSDRTYFLSERLRLFSIKTIKGKLAQYILARTQNGNFTLDKSQTVLAEYFGVTRPSLSRSLSEMIEGEIISLQGKSGKIKKKKKMKMLIMQ